MSRFKRLDRVAAFLSRLFDRIAIGANALGTIVVLVLVAVMNVDVVARGVFHAPFRGVVEVVIFSMILIVFLQLPDVIRVDRLTRSDGFMAVLGERRPRLGRFWKRAVDAVACVFMGLAAYASWPVFAEAFESCHYFIPPEFGPPFTGDLFTDLADATARCDYFGTPGVFTAPWWPARLVITFGTGLGCILFLFKALFGGRPALLHLEQSERTGEP
jgi:TRAP-type C4-dicarboxylate transport system permease small subunit